MSYVAVFIHCEDTIIMHKLDYLEVTLVLVGNAVHPVGPIRFPSLSGFVLCLPRDGAVRNGGRNVVATGQHVPVFPRIVHIREILTHNEC
jgi:hypothetical protein